MYACMHVCVYAGVDVCMNKIMMNEYRNGENELMKEIIENPKERGSGA